MKGIAAALLLAVVATAANECPSNWQEEKLLVHPDCNKFYKCTYGEPVELSCWGDLYFNINTWECDWQANVDCGDRNVPGQEPAPQPEPEPEAEVPEPEPEVPETEPEVPEQEPEVPEQEPEVPEQEPEVPEQEPKEPEPEVPELEPEVPEQEPEVPEQGPEVPEPESEVPEQEPDVPEPEPEQDDDFLPNGCPVDPHVHWLLPAEDDCNGFYYCVWGIKERRACPPTLHFNREIQVCDWPAQAGCVSSFNKHVEARFASRF